MLYGKLQASNDEVHAACELANCNDFIEEQKEREALDKENIKDLNPKQLISSMTSNKDRLQRSFTKKRFEE